MSESLAFRLSTALFFQEIQSPNTALKQQAQHEPIHVYAPEKDARHLSNVLRRNRIPHRINQYPPAGSARTLCFYRRSELNAQQIDCLVRAASSGMTVEPLLEYLDRRLDFVEVELLHGDYLLDNALFRQDRKRFYLQQKRLLDVGAAMLLLVLTLPVWLLTALAIRLESAGPVFFRQRRTGLFNQEFDIIKFRSMSVDAEKNGARWASKNDRRVTRVGRFIRKTRIDELPQLINVLRGEMSLIGPRPEREVFIRDLEKQIPFYRFRHMVRPGITGLAQVRHTYGASVEDAMCKHRHDIYYLKHQSLWMDLKILLQTIRIVVTGQGI